MTLRKNTHLQSRGSKNAVKDLIVSNYICHALAISQKVYLFHICVYDKKIVQVYNIHKLKLYF